MQVTEAIAILIAGVAAGTINTIVGSGTLITFPTLLFLGYPPLVANVSNNIGLVAGSASGAWGYRRELAGNAALVRRLVPASLVGSVLGATLLLILPSEVFAAVVPALIALSLVLVLVGPRLSRRSTSEAQGQSGSQTSAWLPVAVFGAGVYGGYFGAAQGVLLMGIFAVLSSLAVQRANAMKNILAMVVNLVAAIVFVLVARSSIDWTVVALIGAGALVGGIIGARIGRRLPPSALRALIVVVGVTAIARLTVFA